MYVKTHWLMGSNCTFAITNNPTLQLNALYVSAEVLLPEVDSLATDWRHTSLVGDN
jgi:hypothetical protein